MEFLSHDLKTCPIPKLPEKLAIKNGDTPFDVFGRWFSDAAEYLTEPNAMAVATVNDQQPANRIVYLRGWDERGFVFFTNLRSAKGTAIDKNHHVEALFYWKEVWRQVRIRGLVNEVEKELADAYFAQRKRESQLGAWASLQSQSFDSYEDLDGLVVPKESDVDPFEYRLDYFRRKFEGVIVPRPPHWSGLRIIPSYFEFWQGRDARLHDRWCFKRVDDPEQSGESVLWSLDRLFP